MAFRTFHRSTYKNVCGSCRSSASLITLTDTLSYHANCSGSRLELRSLFGMASGPRLRSPLSAGQDSWPSPGVHRLGYVGRWLSREHATADPDGQQGICSRSSTITAGNSSTTSSRLTARSRSSRASSAYVPTCFDGRELTIFSDEDAARLRPESDAQCLRQGPGQLLSGGENPQASSIVYHPHLFIKILVLGQYIRLAPRPGLASDIWRNPQEAAQDAQPRVLRRTYARHDAPILRRRGEGKTTCPSLSAFSLTYPRTHAAPDGDPVPSRARAEGPRHPRVDGAHRTRAPRPRRPGLLIRPARVRVQGRLHGLCQGIRVRIHRVSAAGSQLVSLLPLPLFSPAVGDVVWTQEITPYLSYLGPAWFRRFLLNLVPIAKVQRLKSITDVLSTRLEQIYYAKKTALESGDEELLNSLGEGKDVMSVLCECAVIYY